MCVRTVHCGGCGESPQLQMTCSTKVDVSIIQFNFHRLKFDNRIIKLLAKVRKREDFVMVLFGNTVVWVIFIIIFSIRDTIRAYNLVEPTRNHR